MPDLFQLAVCPSACATTSTPHTHTQHACTTTRSLACLPCPRHAARLGGWAAGLGGWATHTAGLTSAPTPHPTCNHAPLGACLTSRQASLGLGRPRQSSTGHELVTPGLLPA